MSRVLPAAVLLLAFVHAPVVRAAGEPQRCDATALAVLAHHLEVAHFAPRPSFQVEGDPAGVVVAAVCKRMPGDPRLTLAAVAWNAGRQDSKSLVLAMLDERAGAVVASYREEIDEDAAVHIDDYSLRLDTAPYTLAPGVRAVGLDISSENHGCGDGGFGPRRTLYVREGSRLRPVLAGLYIQKWRYLSGGGARCNRANVETVLEQYDITIGLGAPGRPGWADLELTVKASGDEGRPNRKPLHVRVPYDGKVYPLDAFDKAYEVWSR